jgi:glycosyltransferase involved in cell wall biosynthesis
MIRTVVHFVPSAEFGGTEQALLHLLAGLDRRRWRPVLFHYAEPGISPLLRGTKSLDIESQEVPRMLGKHPLITRLTNLIGKLRAERAAVFHAHLNHPLACKTGLMAATLARVPAIVATAQLFVELPLSRFVYARQRIIGSVVDRYIAVSQDVATRMSQTFSIPIEKIDIVHNAISLTPFDKPRVNNGLRAILQGSTGRPLVLTPARLDKQKGHCYLLEAAALVPEAIFVLAGEGPERANLEAQARQLGLGGRVVFLGHRDDIPDLLACCDLFVLPSLFEGLPLTILEAMAAHKPVIASAIAGNDEAIVSGKSGLLVPPKNPAALARAIRSVLSNPELAQRLAAAGRERVHQRFSAESMVQRVSQIYDDILSRKGAEWS